MNECMKKERKKERKKVQLKPNYFKKQSSLSSFLLTLKVIIQVQTGLEYSAG
jgi:hypothetical protein